MSKEIETKVLDIDPEEIKNRLEEKGAERRKDAVMKRWVFDIDPENYEWIRLRDNGKKVTIAYKNKSNQDISGTREIETEIGDFEKAYKLLSRLDFKETYYQENKRTAYQLEDIEFTIDKWPRIPPYLEVESNSEEKVKEGLEILGLREEDAGNISVKDVYSRYREDLHSYEELKLKEEDSYK